ncbi:kinase-like protein [Thelephora ganbajun]|uniref:Kinase-like protein n=1 Tax=Thelephora ganbajun TaxID=370292 RepID=A0ACB6ZUG4_THEGA|nr:kinase-like protein [Thelephora ganbajun]
MSSRPLPTPPTMPGEGYWKNDYLDPRNDPGSPFYPFTPHRSFGVTPTTPFSDYPTALRGGTILHKGFYDLLALIPSTPSPSRFFWPARTPQDPEPIAGPRYEEIPSSPPNSPPVQAPSSPPPPLRKGRRISKDMVSKPTGFVHLVHASDADQAHALLTRWGPEGQGKLGDPRWANPIKDMIRQNNQARAVNEVVNALKPSTASRPEVAQLRVINGISTNTSSTITTAARENVSLTPVDGFPGQPGNSTIRWMGGLHPHLEHDQENDPTIGEREMPRVITPPPPRPINPSLTTLEKAVSARIYFENLYFPLLRSPPSREQRRLAMEREMAELQLSEHQKENLRTRWRQNETDYLRHQRRKVDVTAFVKLKTIGHGAFGVVSLVREKSTGGLFAMKELRKTDMLRKGQEGHVRAERDILKSASLVSSPGGAEWIVRLFYSFQDRDHLYLVLEYMGGGDLLNLLIERDVFEEDFTRFYVAEMVLAIEACHKFGFIHRDIKPDNFLFDPSGHIKLSDFGLAYVSAWSCDYEQQRLHLLHKHGVDLEDTNALQDGMRTKRMNRKDIELLMGGGDGEGGVFTWREKHGRKVGFVSPEVIRGHGYTFSCDWWSLGVIMFECLYGHVTRQKILNWKQSLKFPSKPRVSHEGINLMQQLLCEPEDRLGSQATASVSRPNSLLVQSRRSGFIPPVGQTESMHLWFRGIDWENIHRYPAPYHPELKNPEDTRHFDADIPAEPLAPANGAPADATRDPLLRDKVHGEEILKVRKALAFAGFTHKSPRVVGYVRADKAFDPEPDTYGNSDASPLLVDVGGQRGRSTIRDKRDVGKSRAISM